MYDVAIIGAGAAGVSAALTLKALNKNIIIFGQANLSSKINKAELIRNYPGLPFTSGENMKNAFLEQLKGMDIQITPNTVTGIYDMGDYFGILCNQETFDAKSVILAVGVESVKPIKGEMEYLGRGVSYCATCDGFLYKNKTIAVVCTSKELEHEIEYLAQLAEKVYLIPLYKNVQITAKNIQIVTGMPVEISGSKQVENLVFKDKTIKVDGVFMLKDAVSPSVLISGLDMQDGHVLVNRACETNIKGCFAAGDCTGRPYQYVKAAGEGNVAAHSAVNYLSSLKE